MKTFSSKNRKIILDDDKILIKKILSGKESSFEEIMRKYNKRIFNFVLRMVRNEEVAIELTQDFFIKIFTKLYKYNFEYKFSTWAYRICYNLVIDYIRKNQTYVNSLDDDSTYKKDSYMRESATKEDGADVFEREEVKSYLWKTVSLLPVKYKELILLRYIQELKYDEISEVTSLPIGTVKNRIFKAKDLLRKEIEKDGMLKK